jgi:hypothetical protein
VNAPRLSLLSCSLLAVVAACSSARVPAAVEPAPTATPAATTPPAATPATPGAPPTGAPTPGAQNRGAPTPAAPPIPFPSPLPTGRVTYRTLSETNHELEQIAAQFPKTVKRFELSHKSLLGQRIYALEITHDVQASSGKPVFLMTGLHHAREWPTVDLTMEFAWDLLKNDGVDPVITRLLDSVRVILVPVVNPDGYDLSRSLLNEQKRKNCRITMGQVPTWAECASPQQTNAGVDINRNYGAFWGGSGATIGTNGGSARGEAPFSEPETRAMRDLMASNQVVVALSNHTPDAKVLRVPSSTEEPIPADVDAYDELAQALGRDMSWEAGPWPEIYYTAAGTMEQTAYYSAGTFAFTFEHTPRQRERFHPPYSFVIDQYFGTGAYPASSARNAFLRLLAAAADPARHSVLDVRAPAGAKLTISKSITLETSPLLKEDRTTDPAFTFPMTLTSSITMPAGKTQIDWHVNPSPRPSQKAKEWIPESWTFTCSLNGRTQTVAVSVKRGERATVDARACR